MKVVFSGMIVLVVATVVIGVITSRTNQISANVYYYCWECAQTDEGLGCVQIQHESVDHTAVPACPDTSYPNEGMCALSCIDPFSAGLSSAISVSSDSSSSIQSPSSASSASSQSSRPKRVIIGLGGQSVSFAFAGTIFTIILAIAIGFVSWLRRYVI